nr:integrase, catalytic region, zinc finger, CCHC-type, peptidase aspartic, catalytic [Tanacetum cinerariifolium]
MMNVAGARENVGSPVVQQSGIQCFNCKEFGHFAKECRKPKRVKDFAYHKEKMLLCKQAEQYDWLADTDEEIDDNTCLVETNDSNFIPDPPDMCEDAIQNDQHDVKSDDGTEFEKYKAFNDRTIDYDKLELALQNKQTEFEKYKAFNDRTIDYDKLERKLNETLGQLAQKDIEIKEGLKTKAYEISVVNEKHVELIKQILLTKSHYEGLVKQKTKTCLMPLAIKTQNDSFIFVHELKQEMHADLKYVESLEKEIDELESDKAEFSNMYDMILQECVSKDVMCSYLLSLSDLDALDEFQCLYLHKVKECDCLAQNLSNQTDFILQLILFIVDSGCTKHMTGNLKPLCNFVKKFMGTVRFGNDQFTPILRSYALSWEPCQGDSLNLPDYSLIPAGVRFITTCSCSNYKDILSIKIQESRKLKHKDKISANFDKQDLPSRYQLYQGRLLASFQDDAKYKHDGQDTRSQGGKRRSRQKDKDLNISN